LSQYRVIGPWNWFLQECLICCVVTGVFISVFYSIESRMYRPRFWSRPRCLYPFPDCSTPYRGPISENVVCNWTISLIHWSKWE
jgi:hypothetical protein